MRELVFAWESEFPDDELVVAVPASAFALARWELPPKVRVVRTRLRPQGVCAIFELPLRRIQTGADLVLAHNFTPLFGNSAVFVHDVLFESNPEWFTRRERAYLSLIPLTVRFARRVFTSSATEAARIDRLTPCRVKPIPVGIAIPRTLVEAEPDPVAALAGVDGFVLLVGRLNVRKNLRVAIEAALAADGTGKRRPVVVVGERSGRETVLTRTICSAVESGEVVFTGFVTDGQLSWLYLHASLLVFLSLGEGFGIPSLEAMHFGTPILASDIPVFHEVLGPAGAYVDPHDKTAIAQSIDGMLAGSFSPARGSAERYTWAGSVRAIRAGIL